MLLSDRLRIGKYPIALESFEVLPEIDDMPEQVWIRMLGPLVVYSTLTHPNSPTIIILITNLFSSMIEANLKRRYFSMNSEDPELLASSVTIRPIQVTPRDKVITRFRGLIIEGWMGEFELSGDPRGGLITSAWGGFRSYLSRKLK